MACNLTGLFKRCFYTGWVGEKKPYKAKEYHDIFDDDSEHSSEEEVLYLRGGTTRRKKVNEKNGEMPIVNYEEAVALVKNKKSTKNYVEMTKAKYEEEVKNAEDNNNEDVKDDKVADDASKPYKGTEYHDMLEDAVDDSGEVTSNQGMVESAGQESEEMKLFSMFESAENDDPSS